VHYVRHPFPREPDFGVTSVNYDFRELLARVVVPALHRPRVPTRGSLRYEHDDY